MQTPCYNIRVMKKVLIIEDDTFIGGLVAKEFQKENMDVDHAVTAESGMEKIKENRPDLILLDIMLPDMDGYEFLEKIKSDKELSSIPVFILSNVGEKEEIERCFALGAQDFWVKAHHRLDEIVNKAKHIIG